LIFKLAAAAISDFQKFENVTVGSLCGGKMTSCAKFHQNQTDQTVERYRDLTVLTMVDGRHFKVIGRQPTTICTPLERYLVVFIVVHCKTWFESMQKADMELGHWVTGSSI